MARHLRDSVIACAALALLPVAGAAAQTSSGTGLQGATGEVVQPRASDTRGQETRNSVGSDVDSDLRKADQDIREAEKDLDRSPWLRESVRKLTDQ